MNIIWLASYPKSGNTYLRFLIYNYLYAEVSESIEVENKMPDIHKLLSSGRGLNTELNQSVFAKTHFCYNEKHPYHKDTRGFIYIIRNPRDVLLSNSRYSGVTGNQQIDLQAFAHQFINLMGVPRWKKMNMGTWPEHIATWLSATSQFPHLFLKYEELRKDPVSILKNIIQFLNLEFNEKRLNRAIEMSSLEVMRVLEKKEKENSTKTLFDDQGKDQYFVGEGKSNQSLAHIGEDTEELFQNRFGRVMNIFGY
tara:strand:- start:544 stop:1302 length:759 start_codon:yes stop_codon:yes gene_type:complete